jgi:hypothetical protein
MCKITHGMHIDLTVVFIGRALIGVWDEASAAKRFRVFENENQFLVTLYNES